MLKLKLWTVVASAVIVAAASSDAGAFCHKYRSIPVWFGVYYPNCGPCGGCIMPYVASGCYSGYGYCGIGCGGCGYGCGHGCFKKHHHFCGHKFWKHCLAGCGSCFDCCGCCDDCGDCGYCGIGCDGGCGGCGDGGCSSGCAGGGCGTAVGGGENVISDGPVPADDAPPAATSDQSARVRRPMMLMAGYQQGHADGSAAFEKGLAAYRQGSMNDAAREFETAAATEPNNALYHYYRALALHSVVGAEGAADARQQAVEAELRQPIKGWGKRMERVQGSARLWIEKARREAGLAR
jgi:hypothetical protein